MALLIEQVDPKTYLENVSSFSDNLPIWLSSKFVDIYKEKIILIAKKGKEIKAVWVVPIAVQDALKIAKRNYRFFPYSSPFIFEIDNLKRREIMSKFFEKITEICETIYLPFDPDFKETSAIQGYGALVEWRHTHRLSSLINDSQIDSRLRNHIKSANNNIEISIDQEAKNFNFKLAIKGSFEEQKEREKLAMNLLKNNQAIIISAKNKNKLCAGILLAYDKKSAYMMHSWQLEDTPRGTISSLIFESINWAFKTGKLKNFDFEGSVIQNIDYFFCGFNAEIVPHAFIHWSRNKNKLHSLIDKSINIDGRLFKKTYE